MSPPARAASRRDTEPGRFDRAQSSVVGVALLLGVGVVALGLLTASVGAMVDAQLAAADADAVAGGLSGLRDGAVAGRNGTHPVHVARGDLSRTNRTVRVLAAAGPNRTYDADGYVATVGTHRVALVGGAVVRGTGDRARLATPAPLSLAGGSAFLAVPTLTANATDGGGFGSRSALRVRTSRDVVELPDDAYAVAVETETPGAWARALERRGFETTRREFDGDGVPSVVATVPGDRTLTIARYNLTVVVDRG